MRAASSHLGRVVSCDRQQRELVRAGVHPGAWISRTSTILLATTEALMTVGTTALVQTAGRRLRRLAPSSQAPSASARAAGLASAPRVRQPQPERFVPPGVAPG